LRGVPDSIGRDEAIYSSPRNKESLPYDRSFDGYYIMKYQVYLEIDPDGYCAAHIPELLGLYVFSQSQKQTLRQLPGKIKEYQQWLKRHGEKVAAGKIEIEIREIKYGTCPRISGNRAAIFEFDLLPPTNKEIKTWLKRAAWNRQELKEIVAKLPDDVLDRKEKGKRSIRGVLHHVANCDWWYVSRLNIELDENGPKETFARLDWARKVATHALLNLSEKGKTQIIIPTKYCGSTRGEKWTARKVFRRLLEHEHEHIENIRETLSRFSQDEINRR